MPYDFVPHADVPDLIAQLTDLSNLAFAEYEGAPQVDRSFTEWYLRRPGCRPELCFAALREGQLVANVLVALQWLNLGGEFVVCGIVDTVATHPEHRQRGLARTLMALAHSRMRAEGAQASVLYTNPANHPYDFYGRLGYFTRARAGLLTGRRPAAGGEYEVQVAPAGPGDEVRALVNARYERYEGFARLDDRLWDWHRARRPSGLPARVLLARRRGEVVGTVALAEVEVLLAGHQQRVTVISDAVYPDLACLQDLLSLAPQPELMSLQALDAPERQDLERLGLQTSVGEVAMVLPLRQRARRLLHREPAPWYVMAESVVGV